MLVSQKYLRYFMCIYICMYISIYMYICVIFFLQEDRSVVIKCILGIDSGHSPVFIAQ